VAGCAYPIVFVRTDPHIAVLFPGESITVTLTTDAPRCTPSDQNPDQPCVDVTGQVFDYVVQNVPAGVTTSIDASLQSSSTPGVVRITVAADEAATPGLYEMVVHATLAGRSLGTATLGVRILAPGVVTTAAPAAIAAGYVHSLAVLADGTLLAWGGSDEGQLGLGDRNNRLSPSVVTIGVRVRDVAAGVRHSMAVGVDGTVWAWGDNSSGQLGLGEGAREATRPRQVPGLNVHAIAAGGSFSVALVGSRTVWSWGSGAAGGNRSSPGRVEGLTDVQAIAAGEHHALALRSDGTVWAWGRNDLGEVGVPGLSLDPVEIPVQVPNLTGVIAIAAGSGFSLAVRVDGTVWAWGRQIGDGARIDEPSPVPARVVGLDDIRTVAAGQRHALALRRDGTVWAWGRSPLLGDGIIDPDPRGIPVQVRGVSGVRAIAVGYSHSLSAVDCGQLWAWGASNFDGELGDGAGAPHYTPVPVADIGPASGCPRVAVRISVAGEGDGRVIGTPGDVLCHDRECLGVFDQGTAVTLTAVPFFDSRFERWALDCQGQPAETALVLDARKHCVARFGRATPDPFLLSVVTGGGRVTSSGGGVLGPDRIDCDPTCSAIFPGNTEVMLSAADAGGFGFTGWSLDCGGTARQTSVLMDAPHTCRADFRAFRLGVTVSGVGRVTSDPAGLDCGPMCSYAPREATAALRAEPAPGWQFDGWGGDCTGAALQTTVTMDADRACTATFSRLPSVFFLTMIVEGTGSVTSVPAGIDCPGECVALFAAGTTVELTALETPQSLVLGWFDDCAAPGVLVNRVVMDGDRTCRLRFTDRPAVPVALFTFAPGPYAVGEVITFDASASHVLDPITGTQDLAGIRVFSWDFDSDGTFEATGPRGTTAIAQHSFPAPGTYTVRLQVQGGPFDETADRLHDVTIVTATGTLRGLTVQKAGDGEGRIATTPPGLIGCGPGCTSAGPVPLEDGTVVTLVAAADPGSAFTGWSGSGCTSAAATVQVTMSQDRVCTAVFARDSFTLTVSRTAGGRVTSAPAGIDCGSDCSEGYGPGTAVTLTASPDPGFAFDGWSEDCGGTDPVTDVVLDDDRMCHATFSPASSEPMLTVEVIKPPGSIGWIIGVAPPGNPINCGGTGPVCVATFPAGTEVTVRANDTSIELNLFGAWSGCDSVGGLAACTVTLSESRTVTATFIR
jgi:alpha-tubulin suppressor-like RCC1 family protein